MAEGDGFGLGMGERRKVGRGLQFPRWKITKEYLWILFQFHKDKLTKMQRKYIEGLLDSNKCKKIDRRFAAPSVKRLKILEYQLDQRRL